MKLTPSMLRLYAVTDRSWSADEADFWRRVSEAMEGGAQVVQLREKHLSHEGGAVCGAVPQSRRGEHHQR